MQVVLDCYRASRSATEAGTSLKQLVDALIYFNVPVKRWPLGAQLHQNYTEQQQKDTAAAIQIASALKTKLASSSSAVSFGLVAPGASTKVSTNEYFFIVEKKGSLGVDSAAMVGDNAGIDLSKAQKAALDHAAAAECMRIIWSAKSRFRLAICTW